jgi:hypothetical protein
VARRAVYGHGMLILAQHRRILDGCQLEKIIGVQSTRLAVNTAQCPFRWRDYYRGQ